MTNALHIFAAPPLAAWVWQPIAAPLHILGGGVLLAALAVFAYVRVYATQPKSAIALLAMRLAAIGAVSVLLLGPSREKPRPDEQHAPRLTVMVDTSESMRTADCGERARIAHVAENVLNASLLDRLRAEFRVELRGFDERAHPLSLETLRADPALVATGRATHLAESVAGVVAQLDAERDGDVLLVVSDGRDSEDAAIEPAAAAAKAKRIPIYTVAVGGQSTAPEAAVLAVPMQESLYPGESGAIQVKIFQSGLSGRSTTLRFQHGETVTEYPIEFGERNVVEMQLPIKQDEPGRYRFDVSVDAVGDETELANNAQTVFCEVMKRRIRVLLLEAQPFWDTKFLAESLRKDERVELTQITQLAVEKRETIVSRVENASPKIPATAEEWANFEVIILGRGMERILDADAVRLLAARIVDGGGQLILARGRPYDANTDAGQAIAEAFAPLEPVTWGSFELQQLSLELTPSGRGSPWLAPIKMGIDVADAFARLPGFDVMRTVDAEKPATLVLARAVALGGPEASNQPAIVQMNYGRGAVLAILGEGLWRWSLIKPEAQDLRGFYDAFWSNLIRYLALGGDFPPGQQVALQLSRTTARLGDPLTADVSYKIKGPEGESPRLELIAPDGTSVDVALHKQPGPAPRYRAALEPTVAGIHKVRVLAPGMTPAELEQEFNVYDVNLERLYTAANPLALQQLAEQTGGQHLTDDGVGELENLLERHLASLEVPPQLEFIWDQGWILAALLGWMGVEWIVRRTAGLW